jgi:hypothetical protein
MKDKIAELCEKVKDLNEAEYGDFKRKVNLYLLRTGAELRKTDVEERNKLREIQQQLLYGSNADIESARSMILSAFAAK